MKHRLYLVSLAAALIAVAACNLSRTAQKKPADEPPLLLDDGPLLLEEPSESVDATALKVDNSRCHVCHMNYADEELSIQHAKGGIGCETCHGDSSAHCGDEDNITPPDKMYAKDEILSYCMSCHPAKELSAEEHKKVLKRKFWQKQQYCTDCHGEHRLAVRTRIWDKKTRKLLVSDGVRMMEDQPVKKN